ncbi:hypothetical protein RJ639_046896 [Escallonia herrerae]|uniref:Uncharacterized protein n=1 Tax=Escallonia herrerae TaxID=1293975 RepID=A0AA88WA90_9ASTE|nr:hypothetical protein RJ639_046896 [Escallonia herrerae]
MTTVATLLTAVIAAALTLITSVHALGGSAPTVAVSYGDATTVCGIPAEQQTRGIQCWREDGQTFCLSPYISFDSVAGGWNLICGVRSGGFSLLCWNTTFSPKRLYYNATFLLQDLTVGDHQICALTNGTRNANCCRDDAVLAQLPSRSAEFRSISSGLGFSCGILMNTSTVTCWGSSAVASVIQGQFGNLTMSSIAVGGNHACGLNTTGFLECRGSNDFGQLGVQSNSPFEYSALALGANHTCAIRRMNNTVICWGRGADVWINVTEGVSFESIVAGLDFTCGLRSTNFTVICWGPGWRNDLVSSGVELPLPSLLPGACVQESTCNCGIYPESQKLCSGNGNICRPCDATVSAPPVSPPPTINPPRRSPSRAMTKGLLAFAIVGSVGAFSGIVTIVYCLWTGVCCGHKKIHNSVQPTIAGSNSNAAHTSNTSPLSRSSTIRRQGSRAFRRQRSGTSSKHTERAEEFTFSDLVAATNNFSLENRIGAGSFVGYIDPEYYGLNVLTAKSDVYGLGVVLLELLTGKRAIFKIGENGGAPISVVDFAVPAIMAGELSKILDTRVGPPELNEAEAVELVAYTAMHCVNLEGRERPTITDIVANLERALALCDDSHGSISSGPISLISE